MGVRSASEELTLPPDFVGDSGISFTAGSLRAEDATFFGFGVLAAEARLRVLRVLRTDADADDTDPCSSKLGARRLLLLVVAGTGVGATEDVISESIEFRSRLVPLFWVGLPTAENSTMVGTVAVRLEAREDREGAEEALEVFSVRTDADATVD